MMVMQGRFTGSAGVPETMLMPSLPERFLAPGSPFRTIAELASSIPWLLRVHQSMQWVQQMPNGLMTVQRLICPAASELGGLAAPDGVLAVDWQKVEEVMGRSAEAAPQAEGYRPSMAGDPRFPRGAQPFQPRPDGPGMITGADGVPVPAGEMVGTDGQMQPTDAAPMPPPPQPEKGGGGGGNARRRNNGGRGGDQQGGGGGGGHSSKRGGRGGNKGGNPTTAPPTSDTAATGDKPGAGGSGGATAAAKSEGGSAGGEAKAADAAPAPPKAAEQPTAPTTGATAAESA